MSIFYGVLRELGFDTVTRESQTRTLKKFTVTHTNENQREVLAHYKLRKKGGFVVFVRHFEDPVVHSEAPEPKGEKLDTAFRPFLNRKYKAAELESITEIEATKAAEEEFWVEYDKADGIVKDYGYNVLEEYE